jgi:hypothetical protein
LTKKARWLVECLCQMVPVEVSSGECTLKLLHCRMGHFGELTEHCIFVPTSLTPFNWPRISFTGFGKEGHLKRSAFPFWYCCHCTTSDPTNVMSWLNYLVYWLYSALTWHSPKVHRTQPSVLCLLLSRNIWCFLSYELLVEECCTWSGLSK